MPAFARQFYALARRLFPPAAPGMVTPGEVTDTVSLVHPLFKPDIAHNIRLRREVLSITSIVGTNILHHQQPATGWVMLPILWTVFHQEATYRAATVEIRVDPGAEPLLDNQKWDDSDRTLATVVAVGGQYTSVGVTLPLTAGNHWSVTFLGMTAGLVIRSSLYWVDVPVECVDWSRFGFAQLQNSVRNVPG